MNIQCAHTALNGPIARQSQHLININYPIISSNMEAANGGGKGLSFLEPGRVGGYSKKRKGRKREKISPLHKFQTLT